MLLRSALHRRGLRFRKNVKQLPGTPDIVFPRYKACIFVHGCFWHRHGCARSTSPTANAGYWEAKFQANVARDAEQTSKLLQAGHRVLIVWECALVGRRAGPVDLVAQRVEEWLERGGHEGSIP